MQLNSKKCKKVYINGKEKLTKPAISLNGNLLELVDSYKYLGIDLNIKLNWSEQWNRVLSNINSTPFLLRTLKWLGFNKEILINVYCSLVLCHINNSSVALGSTSAATKSEIEN
jgi:hypothetical protein